MPDLRLRPTLPAPTDTAPDSDDWVRTVREANGMSTADLARMLEVPV